MPHDRLDRVLQAALAEQVRDGTAKGAEAVISGVIPATDGLGPRFLLAGHGDKPFLRMNSNSYLGLSSHPQIIAAEEKAAREFGAGPGAVRFISGTCEPHIALERRLAEFHGREGAMIFSSAYASVMGVMPALLSDATAVISDQLNHNSIINAIRLARPAEKRIYRHLDMAELARHLQEAARTCRRAVIVTDGVFSMRGDHAPLDEIADLARAHDADFAENVLVVVDDSHGVGAFGPSGRGTEEVTGAAPADLLIATLGKAFGVNGGYVAAGRTLVDYLRETSPFYIYSNPITPGEAAAAKAAIDVVDSADGRRLLDHLRTMTAKFEAGLRALGLETIPGEHPVVPLMVRDTGPTSALVGHLLREGVLATGLTYPVVPKGDEEIRFQICAAHTPADIDQALDVIGRFPG